MHLISNNWNPPPTPLPVWEGSDAQPLKTNPLCLSLFSHLKQHSSQTFVSLRQLLEFCWWLSSVCGLRAFCVRHSRWGPTLWAVLMAAAITRTMNEFLWCDRKGRDIINKDKEADGCLVVVKAEKLLILGYRNRMFPRLGYFQFRIKNVVNIYSIYSHVFRSYTNKI